MCLPTFKHDPHRPYPETGKRIARPNLEREWVTKDVPELRIIGDDLWERVQAIKQRYSSRWAIGDRGRNVCSLVSSNVAVAAAA